jgi:hypothetical protein
MPSWVWAIIIRIMIIAVIWIVVMIPVGIRIPGTERAPVVGEIIRIVVPVSIRIAIIEIQVRPHSGVANPHTEVTVVVITVIIIIIPVFIPSATVATVLAVIFLVHPGIFIPGNLGAFR